MILLLSNQIPSSVYVEEDTDELIAGWAVLVLSEDDVHSSLCHKLIL